MQETCSNLNQIHSHLAVNVLSKKLLKFDIVRNFIICRYTCTYVGDHQGSKMYSWNTTISDNCCLGCDGKVHKADSVIEETLHEDECLSVETSICRRIPGKFLPQDSPKIYCQIYTCIQVKKRPRLRWNTVTGTAAMTALDCSLSRLSCTCPALAPREPATMTT